MKLEKLKDQAFPPPHVLPPYGTPVFTWLKTFELGNDTYVWLLTYGNNGSRTACARFTWPRKRGDAGFTRSFIALSLRKVKKELRHFHKTATL